MQYEMPSKYHEGAMSGGSSLASLSCQLEESAANQLKERSKRALELMKVAVKWKSWEELRTLSKAFQAYLEDMRARENWICGMQELREDDLQRKRDLETTLFK